VLAIEALLAAKERFSAVFLSSDEMAMGAYQVFHQHGFNIPNDFSVVGFDDVQLSRYANPPLTTVAQPQVELGREAMMLLLEIINNKEAPSIKRILPTELVVRGSTSAPRRA
jgi:LacI family repressor for deo operon, udp, cdd, tsx, nupC, and nupG